MMSHIPPCPSCQSEHVYNDGELLICPECAHEWLAHENISGAEEEKIYRDAFGNVLQDGDAVTVIKDLRPKGASGTIKMGTRIKNIRLVDRDHDIECKIEGFGSMSLKTEFVKKI